MMLMSRTDIMENSWPPIADTPPIQHVFQETNSPRRVQSFSNSSTWIKREIPQRENCTTYNQVSDVHSGEYSGTFLTSFDEVHRRPLDDMHRRPLDDMHRRPLDEIHRRPLISSSELQETWQKASKSGTQQNFHSSDSRRRFMEFSDYKNGFTIVHSKSSSDLSSSRNDVLFSSRSSSPGLGVSDFQSIKQSLPLTKTEQSHGSMELKYPNYHHIPPLGHINQSAIKPVHNRPKSDMLVPAHRISNGVGTISPRALRSPYSPTKSCAAWGASCINHCPVSNGGGHWDDFTAGISSRADIAKSVDQFLTGFSNTGNLDQIPSNNYKTQRNITSGPSQERISQASTDISGTTAAQTWQFTMSRDSIFAYGNDSGSRITEPSSTDNADFADGTAAYNISARRRSSDHWLRRAVSYEPESQQPKPVIVKTPSHGEIESEYVYLDNRYMLDKHASQFSASADRLPRLASHTSSLPHYNSRMRLTNYNHNKHTSQNDATNSMHAIQNNTTNFVNAVDSSNEVNSNRSLMGASLDLDQRKHVSDKKTNNGPLRSMAETIGSLFSSKNSDSSRSNGSPRNLKKTNDSLSGSQNRHNRSLRKPVNGPPLPQKHIGGTLVRSKSLPDLQASEHTSGKISGKYSDDEDGDDFGFLSYPISFTSSYPSAAMNKAKSSSPGSKIIPKRWRSRTNAGTNSSNSVAMWTPGPPGSCTWSSVSGRKVQLHPVSILCLTEAERITLQKLAASRLQSMDVGSAISIPKDASEQPRAKKSPLSLKRRSKSVSASALDMMAKDGSATGMVFGIPLFKCILNDRELEKSQRRMESLTPSQSSPLVTARTDSTDNLLMLRSARKSSSSSQDSAEHSGMASQNLDCLTVPSYKRAGSSDSLSESESSRNTSSSLIDALSLSTSNPASRPSSLAIDGSQLANLGEVQVPYIVKACFRHIETYGLQTLGIFRVGSSKKRVKQLREEFDSGKYVKLTEEHNPHDVGALLKEYFRDLPEPLLTRELYLPFLHAERLKDEHRRHSAINLLISMLPVANRDTLWALLRFLATVSQHASDVCDDIGGTSAGNKMDAHNLATLFGPNILHGKKPSSDKELMSESTERVEQSKEVIEVVKDLIDNHHELFEISGSLRDDVLRSLVESNQEIVDKILKHLANQNQIEADPESMSSVFEDSSIFPIQYHTVNSDADLLLFARRQTSASHRPLRVTKSADDSLDSPTSQSPILASHNCSMLSKDNHKASLSDPVSTFEFGPAYPSPTLNKNQVLNKPCDSPNEEATLRGRLEQGKLDCPYSEGFNQNLNIPQPPYFRGNSYSSTSSSISPSFKNHSGTDTNLSEQWIFSALPTCQAPPPKQLFQSTSPSTVIPSMTVSQLNNAHAQGDSYLSLGPANSAEMERERWKYWEKIAAQKQTTDSEQETLV